VRFKAEAQTTIDTHFSSLETRYRDIHAAPELAFQQVKTAAQLAAEMRALGFEVTEKVGKTGIVAILKIGPGPTILLNTEIDVLPMDEKTSLPFARKFTANYDGHETLVTHR
jgi:metal-dependent amidase/aminoacylase/carboxypeptidase family protein